MYPSSMTWRHYQPVKTRLSTRQECWKGTVLPLCLKSTSSSRKRAKRASRGPWSTTEMMSPCTCSSLQAQQDHTFTFGVILIRLISSALSGMWKPRKTEWLWSSARCLKTMMTSSSAKFSCRWGGRCLTSGDKIPLYCCVCFKNPQ